MTYHLTKTEQQLLGQLYILHYDAAIAKRARPALKRLIQFGLVDVIEPRSPYQVTLSDGVKQIRIDPLSYQRNESGRLAGIASKASS